MRRNNYVVTLLLFVVILLAACTPAPATPTPGASVTGAVLDEAAAGRDLPFTMAITGTRQQVGVDFRGTLISGGARVQIVDAQDGTVWQETVTTVGPFLVNKVIQLDGPTDYRLGLAWDEPVQMTYALQWAPGQVVAPAVTPIALLGGIGMILVGIGFIVYAGVRRLGWAYLGLGALAWVIAVVLKFAWAIAMNGPVYSWTQTLPQLVGDPLFYVYVGLLTGIFEIAVLWPVLRYTRLGKAPWAKPLAFGIGFGAMEAIVLGLNSLVTMLTALYAPALIPPEAMQQLAAANDLWLNFVPISERFFTILVHIFAKVLVFYAVATRQARWFWLSFIYMSLIDALAAWAQLSGLTTSRILLTETIVAVWGIIGWLGTRWVARHYPGREPEASQP
jgi:uncharacterized membrane protein YhfC